MQNFICLLNFPIWLHILKNYAAVFYHLKHCSYFESTVDVFLRWHSLTVDTKMILLIDLLITTLIKMRHLLKITVRKIITNNVEKKVKHWEGKGYDLRLKIFKKLQ